MRSMVGLRTLVAAMSLGLLFFSSSWAAQSASFDIVKEERVGEWYATLFRNRSGGRLFCAAYTQSGGTILRINEYLSPKEAFLELYNPDWGLVEGTVRFKLEFLGAQPLTVELKGTSWGDSYTYDFLEKDIYATVIGLLAGQSVVTLVNSNDAKMVEFSLAGSGDAIRGFFQCIEGTGAWTRGA